MPRGEELKAGGGNGSRGKESETSEKEEVGKGEGRVKGGPRNRAKRNHPLPSRQETFRKSMGSTTQLPRWKAAIGAQNDATDFPPCCNAASEPPILRVI